MEAGLSLQTSPTLLGRLRCRPVDQAAWNEFVERYTHPIYAWCRRWNLQSADAEEVTQAVLFGLARKMRSFHYDPARRFRAWLKTVVNNACSDFFASRFARDGRHQSLQLLASVEAQSDLQARLKEEFDLELLDEAMARARSRVQATTWHAFMLARVDNVAPRLVAEQLGLSIGQVYVHASRVLRLIQQELQRLDDSVLSSDESAL